MVKTRIVLCCFLYGVLGFIASPLIGRSLQESADKRQEQIALHVFCREIVAAGLKKSCSFKGE